MRKFLFTAFAALIMLCIYTAVDIPFDERSDAERLRERLNAAMTTTYRDSAYGYTMRYPDFFIKDESRPDMPEGSARFVCGDVSIECYIVRNHGHMDTKQGMETVIKTRRAVRHSAGQGFFTVSGPLYEGEGPVPGFSYYAKYVNGGGIWAVCEMQFPDEYKDALNRLHGIIEKWKPWN